MLPARGGDGAFWDQRAVNIFRGPNACARFLESATLQPRRVTVAVRDHFKPLTKLINAHKQWFKSLDAVELRLETCVLTNANMHTLEVFCSNLVKVHLEAARFYCSNYFDTRGWSRFVKLKCFSNRHNVSNGSWPDGIAESVLRNRGPPQKSVIRKLEWRLVDFGTLQAPTNLTELVMDHCDSSKLVCPPNLRVLKFTRNSIRTLNLDTLSSKLITLDLKKNKITRIEGHELPKLLESLDLSHNDIDPVDLVQISSHGWPAKLCELKLHLELLGSLACIFNVPRCLERLSIGGSIITNIDLEEFPSLVELEISSMQLTWVLYETHFPSTLESLTIKKCNVVSLEKFEFPDLLKKLNLSENQIVTLDEYRGWRYLVNLIELDLSVNSVRLGPWSPPPNLEILKLSLNGMGQVKSRLFSTENHHLKLRHLDLSWNRLRDIRKLKFPPLLETLVLDNNEVHRLPHLANVKHLSLRSCKEYDFLFEPQQSCLQTIDLFDNYIDPDDCEIHENLAKIGLKMVRKDRLLNRPSVLVPLDEMGTRVYNSKSATIINID